MLKLPRMPLILFPAITSLLWLGVVTATLASGHYTDVELIPFWILLVVFAVQWRHYRGHARDEGRLRLSLFELQDRLRLADARNDVSQTLAELSALLQSSKSEVEALTILACYAARMFPQSSGGFYLFQASRDLLEPGPAWGESAVTQESFRPDECWALRLGSPYGFICDDRQPVCSHFSKNGEDSYCLPLSSQGEVFGLMTLQNSPDEGTGESARLDLPLLASFAGLGALSLANIRLREKLRNQSIRDHLTSLFNRRFLTESLALQLPRAEREGTELSVVMIDLDHFKQFNDRHGHMEGDRLLVTFSRFLLGALRRGDIACRFGGEEFVLVLPGAGTEAAKRRVETVLADWTASQRSLAAEAADVVTFSAGIATRHPLQLDGDDLIGSADAALYAAKKSGRNQVVSSSEAREAWREVFEPSGSTH